MKVFGRLVILLLPLFLGGCVGRELEERAFPSILAVEWEDYEDVFIEKERDSIKFLDYSHVKAVVFERSFARDLTGLEKMTQALFEDPEFAGNTLIFMGDDDALDLAEEKSSKIGKELQEYYKNHDQESNGVTLTDLVNFFNNQEAALEVPLVKIQKGSLIPSGSVNIQLEKGNP